MEQARNQSREIPEELELEWMSSINLYEQEHTGYIDWGSEGVISRCDVHRKVDSTIILESLIQA